jgi:uncharacterized secreted protein with C-terminal beta-propeller domain
MPEKRLAAGMLIALLAGTLLGAGAVFVDSGGTARPESNETMQNYSENVSDRQKEGVQSFESPEAFRAYMQRADGGAVTAGVASTARSQAVAADASDSLNQAGGVRGDGALESTSGASSDETVNRYSATNVQVQGLDEPDLVKTNGEQAFYSPGGERYVTFRPEPFASRFREPPREPGDTDVLSLSDPAAPSVIGDVNASGKLLLHEETLVVFQNDALLGYDVSDPENPTKAWERPINGQLVTARLSQERLYVVTRNRTTFQTTCPLTPLGSDAPVPCTDVYHPREPAAVDATYTASSVAPDSGEVHDSVGFVGTAADTTVYMSTDALYVTYTRDRSRTDRLIDFLLTTQRDEVPERVRDRLRTIKSYDLSDQAKQVEVSHLLQEWQRSMDPDRRQTVQSNIENDYRTYVEKHQRNFTRTGIVRVNVDDESLAIGTVGTVPGKPLDQFSMDQHGETFRIATTIPGARAADSKNDLYVLGAENLTRLGAEQNMGEGERIYSVRYVGDTAYVVTFRRIDPFHVVDLSTPSDPVEVGQLELPGFSSYLHPVDDQHVLGIGEEDGDVKAVLFDVSDPSDPTIADDYVLDDRWSAISESHHAYLQDRRHEVFFLPGSRGGYVFSYANASLELETAVSTDRQAERAIYVNDYLYVFARDELVVVDENTWERERTVALDE